jgi:hypothetical protein
MKSVVGTRSVVFAFTVFVLLLILLASAGLPLVHANPELNSLTVYGDTLSPNWVNDSSGTTVNVANATPVENGTTSIAVTSLQRNALFRLNRTVTLDAAPYNTLRFWLHGGNSGGQQLKVMLVNGAGQLVNSTVVVTAPAGAGVEISIPLTNLGSPAQITGLALQTTNRDIQSVYYLDNLKFTGPSSATPSPTAMPTATLPAVPPGAYLATFDGAPAAPQPYRPLNWDVTVHSRDRETWYELEPMQAYHGATCDGPPSTHLNTSYEGTVFQCNNHIMTALRASGYGVLYLTPNQMVDFSTGEAVIRFDVSTLRSSNRDWFDLWITPYEDNLQAPLESWLPDLNGEPRRAIHIRMEFGNENNLTGRFDGEIITNFAAQNLPVVNTEGYETFLTPSASQRQTYELRISATHIKFGMPAYNFYWLDTPIAALGWTQGIVQFGHHSYNPMKDCPTCYANTWHWDNVTISPAVPFTILPANRRYAQPGTNTVTFATPAPADARLRFSGIGENLELSFNGGSTWQPAQLQAQEEYHGDHFRTYWTPIPAGTTSVQFRGNAWYAGDWHARDITIWSRALPNGAPQAMPAADSLAWVDFTPLAPEACHLPTDEQLAMLTSE